MKTQNETASNARGVSRSETKTLKSIKSCIFCCSFCWSFCSSVCSSPPPLFYNSFCRSVRHSLCNSLCHSFCHSFGNSFCHYFCHSYCSWSVGLGGRGIAHNNLSPGINERAGLPEAIELHEHLHRKDRREHLAWEGSPGSARGHARAAARPVLPPQRLMSL